jgi:hypothetical protein
MLPNLEGIPAVQRVPIPQRHPLMMKHNPTMTIGPREKDPRDENPSDEATAMWEVLRLKESPAIQRGPHL